MVELMFPWITLAVLAPAVVDSVVGAVCMTCNTGTRAWPGSLRAAHNGDDDTAVHDV